MRWSTATRSISTAVKRWDGDGGCRHGGSALGIHLFKLLRHHAALCVIRLAVAAVLSPCKHTIAGSSRVLSDQRAFHRAAACADAPPWNARQHCGKKRAPTKFCTPAAQKYSCKQVAGCLFGSGLSACCHASIPTVRDFGDACAHSVHTQCHTCHVPLPGTRCVRLIIAIRRSYLFAAPGAGKGGWHAPARARALGP